VRSWKRSRRRAGRCVELIEHLGHGGAVLRTALGALDYQVVHELPPAPHLLQHVVVLLRDWELAGDDLAGQNAIAIATHHCCIRWIIAAHLILHCGIFNLPQLLLQLIIVAFNPSLPHI